MHNNGKILWLCGLLCLWLLGLCSCVFEPGPGSDAYCGCEDDGRCLLDGCVCLAGKFCVPATEEIEPGRCCPRCERDMDCNDLNLCTDDSCVEYSCSNEYNNLACNDSDPCTMDDSCRAGICTGDSLDFDGDSFISMECEGNDCDDNDADVNPAAIEGPVGSPTCSDLIDNDCDELLDGSDPNCSGNQLLQIYRSVGPGNSLPLATGLGNSLTILGNLAKVDALLPANIGLGDAILYDSDGSGSLDEICFIHKRLSSTQYDVKAASGVQAAPVTGTQHWSIFRAYTSLANAEAGNENEGIAEPLRDFDTWVGGKNLTFAGLNQAWNIACYADNPDVTAVTIDGWSTGPENYLRIFTPVGPAEVGVSQRHAGLWSTTAYRLEVDNQLALYNLEDFVRLEGLQIKNISTRAGSDRGGILSEPSTSFNEVWISANIVKAEYNNMTDSGYGIIGGPVADSGLTKIFNNIVYDFDQSYDNVGICCSGGICYIYNNTVYNCCTGFTRTSYAESWTHKNNISYCYAVDPNFMDYEYVIDALVVSENNLSTDNTSPDAEFRNKSVIFLDVGNGNFHLDGMDNSARNKGVNLSGDADLPFSTDIDGDHRSGDWDIGADEF
ncbi:MAG: putative metal-binding motif-containing protein [Deltaproteobacteria bacterium]|nr:putative metal-binding motif-containing protein [Deltaproteobacteria bacterium]